MKKIFLFMVTVLSFIACTHTPLETIVPAPPPNGGGSGGSGGSTSTVVCFETEILPIFLSNCAKSNCHDAATANKGYIFDSYQNIIRRGIRPGRASNSDVYKVLFETGNDKMPPPPNPDLTATQKALIGRWINEGAINTTNCGNACDTTQFAFSANVKNILINNCTGCHGGVNPSNNMNFTTYDGVRPVALNGKLTGAITHTPGFSAMPQNANKLSDCNITIIKKWITSGAPNN